jgi:hypothetical protein
MANSYSSDRESLKHYLKEQEKPIYRARFYENNRFNIELLHPQGPHEDKDAYGRRLNRTFQIYEEKFAGQKNIFKLPQWFVTEQDIEIQRGERAQEAYNNRLVRPIVTLLGHNYLGPGNNLVGQKPLDADDANSERHDIAYSNAHSQGDIEKADKEFIHDAISDVLETGNPHSILGALGIGIKAAAEKVVGPIYPGKWLTSLLLHYVLLTNQLVRKKRNKN